MSKKYVPNNTAPDMAFFHIGISGILIFGQPLPTETNMFIPRHEKKSKNTARIAISPNEVKFGNFDSIQLLWIIKRYLNPDIILQQEQWKIAEKALLALRIVIYLSVLTNGNTVMLRMDEIKETSKLQNNNFKDFA